MIYLGISLLIIVETVDLKLN